MKETENKPKPARSEEFLNILRGLQATELNREHPEPKQLKFLQGLEKEYLATHAEQPSRAYSEGDVEKIAIKLRYEIKSAWFVGQGRRDVVVDDWSYSSKRMWLDMARALLSSLSLKSEQEVIADFCKELRSKLNDPDSEMSHDYDEGVFIYLDDLNDILSEAATTR